MNRETLGVSIPDPVKPSRTHFARLDVLRGIAIILVFFHHYYEGLYSVAEKANDFVRHWPLWMQPWRSVVLLLPKAGYLGVQLFFVISGFCIHGSYLSWRKKNPQGRIGSFTPYFFWRRFWRIVPPFLISLGFSYLLAYRNPLAASSLRKLLLNATLLKTLFPGYFYSVNYAHWSVAVEWQLYLVYPLLLLLLMRTRLTASMAICWVSAFFLQFIAPHYTDSTFILFLPFAWWFEWTLGLMIAERRAKGRTVFRGHRWLVPVLLIALVLSFFYDFGPFGWFVSRVFFGVLVEAVLLTAVPLRRWERALVPIGLCSYSVYLFHLPLIDLYWKVLNYLGVNLSVFSIWLGTGIIAIAVIVAISWFCYRILELGSTAFGERLWRKFQTQEAANKSPPQSANV